LCDIDKICAYTKVADSKLQTYDLKKGCSVYAGLKKGRSSVAYVATNALSKFHDISAEPHTGQRSPFLQVLQKMWPLVRHLCSGM